MKLLVEELKETPIAYLSWRGAFGEPIEKFWREVYYPWAAQNKLLGRERFGISLDDPSVTSFDQCRYDAAVSISPGETLIGNYQAGVIPAGLYAKYYFKGKSPMMGVAWKSFLHDWVPANGLTLSSTFCFEYYPLDSEYDPATGVFSCYLCALVKSK